MDREKDIRDEAVMNRAQHIFDEYSTKYDSLKEALMAASVLLAKLEFAENARLEKMKRSVAPF